ncbi:hypothetical protein A6A06_34435 [Streptomyces sp. CB02923]|uniref:NmrA family NAD(P)-binding protein n=1 Tax=Streptomyces sp. CB02923 TaxID=1718985 RepID=UPI00093A1A77|nr:NAD(P)H-binding protein [Streptomyces sp. CB02923]OKI07973.1 hypothetical protein A6A06_34435 [Streptomyces sp. CB02923]
MFVITGAGGRTGRAAAEELLAAGHPVRVVGRSAARLRPLAERGADVREAAPTDPVALTEAFHGADGAYLVLQPNYLPDHPDFGAFQDRVGESLAEAVAASGVPRVVGLSSWGAQHSSGTGPVAGLHRFERRLASVPDIDVLWLRAGYFMENLLDHVTDVETRGRITTPLDPDLPLPFVATHDLGRRAAHELAAGGWHGTHVLELQGERDLSMREAAEMLAAASGRDALAYGRIDYERISLDSFHRHLRDGGVSENVARMMMEAAEAINTGRIRMEQPRTARTSTPTRLEEFLAAQGRRTPR